jgi:hypothetical protein
MYGRAGPPTSALRQTSPRADRLAHPAVAARQEWRRDDAPQPESHGHPARIAEKPLHGMMAEEKAGIGAWQKVPGPRTA